MTTNRKPIAWSEEAKANLSTALKCQAQARDEALSLVLADGTTVRDWMDVREAQLRDAAGLPPKEIKESKEDRALRIAAETLGMTVDELLALRKAKAETA